MKKTLITKLMAMTMAAALAVGGAAVAAPMTVHAGYNDDIDDGCARDHGEKGHQSGGEMFYDTSDSGSSSNSGSTSSGSSSSSSSDSGSSGSDWTRYEDNDPGYWVSDSSGDSGSAPAETYDYGTDSNAGAYDSIYSSGAENDLGQSSAGELVRVGATVTLPGYETWRQVTRPSTYTVQHMGIEQYTLQLQDADGQPASFAGVGMYKAEDGKWYINVVTADGVDTTGYTIVTWKGSAAYLTRLGISGVMLNGTAVVDAEAVAAAQ